MLKLIELGWKKHNLTKYLIGITICIVANYFASGTLPYVFKIENGLLFTEYLGLMPLMNILIKTTFIIILAIILLRLVINEYKNHNRLPILNIMSIGYMIMQ
ncbi:hypothetical protein FJQ98_14610 [Lysinibacillus agricola]|uniref:DUF5658 domain-containing protein n=1 Tax=Lysinibacillus agricola TaxID=2590012 RepID=A0ABX7AKY9_9BACI|nr:MULTISPECIES: hypothetical protein [Lysinibacillus]QQP10508.1 hypothetical protein FJQ98_14610 [Lysinibacillus agricola]